MVDEQLPQLPPGDESGVLSTISQSLAFHASPDSFLSARRKNEVGPGEENSAPAAVRARILNRNVAIITSYKVCKDILCAADGRSSASSDQTHSMNGSYIRAAREGEQIRKSTFGVLPAYRELMADFFPMPNLLLLDAPDHGSRRHVWQAHMSKVLEASRPVILEIVASELSTWSNGSTLDLYDTMKDLTWKILLAMFLDVQLGEKESRTIISLQENLLRGQFSLFPVSISTPLWRSARSRGLDARRQLQRLLKEKIARQSPSCPFNGGGGSSVGSGGGSIDSDELASNALLFTSSIAVKAISSLLTASLMNLYLAPGEVSLASRLQAHDRSSRDLMLRSILLETERLSPPVIGVMRRVQHDIVLTNPAQVERIPTLVPKGWDAWLYFVGANRDPSVFGHPNKFIPERFMSETSPSHGLAFGFGDKSCLGIDVARQIVQAVATNMLDSGMSLTGTVEERGVQGWLGWDDSVPVEMIAKDLKQLPCQRPRKAIKLRVVRTV